MNAREASNYEGVGDLASAGVRLNNRTFNSLKRDIRKKKEKGMVVGGRVEGATRSTQEGVMDPRTRLLVFKMVNAGALLEVRLCSGLCCGTVWCGEKNGVMWNGVWYGTM